MGAVGAKGSMACTHHLGNAVLPKDKLAGLRALMRRAAAEGRNSRERAMLTFQAERYIITMDMSQTPGLAILFHQCRIRCKSKGLY